MVLVQHGPGHRAFGRPDGCYKGNQTPKKPENKWEKNQAVDEPARPGLSEESSLQKHIQDHGLDDQEDLAGKKGSDAVP